CSSPALRTGCADHGRHSSSSRKLRPPAGHGAGRCEYPGAQPGGLLFSSARGGIMTMYRCYFLGGDSKIKSAEVIECATDADALEAAKQKIATSDYPTIEVWNRARRVGIVDRREADGRFEAPANGAA